MAALLLQCGANPLQVDCRNGGLLISSLRSGCGGPSGVIEFQPASLQHDAIQLLTQAGANWTPSSHHLFPAVFQCRVKLFLLCNARSVVWLPRDARHLVICHLASLEYVDPVAQVADAKRLLTERYRARGLHRVQEKLDRQGDPHFTQLRKWMLLKGIPNYLDLAPDRKLILYSEFLADVQLRIFL
jgi:hypothetical protein